MNKRDKKQIEGLQIVQARLSQDGMNAESFHGIAARLISAMVRCSLSSKARNELLQVAADMGVRNHPEFIV